MSSDETHTPEGQANVDTEPKDKFIPQWNELEEKIIQFKRDGLSPDQIIQNLTGKDKGVLIAMTFMVSRGKWLAQELSAFYAAELIGWKTDEVHDRFQDMIMSLNPLDVDEIMRLAPKTRPHTLPRIDDFKDTMADELYGGIPRANSPYEHRDLLKFILDKRINDPEGTKSMSMLYAIAAELGYYESKNPLKKTKNARWLELHKSKGAQLIDEFNRRSAGEKQSSP